MKDRLSALSDLIREFRYLTLIIGGAFLILSVGFFDINIPSLSFLFEGTLRFFFLGFIIAFLALYYPTRDIVNSNFSKETAYLIIVNATSTKPIIPYEINKESLSLLEWVEGAPFKYETFKGTIVLCESINWMTYEVKGVDIGDMTHHELIAYRESIDTLRSGRMEIIDRAMEITRVAPYLFLQAEYKYYENESRNILEGLNLDSGLYESLNLFNKKDDSSKNDINDLMNQLNIDSVNLSAREENKDNE